MTTPITNGLREYVDAVRTYHLTDVHGKRREYVDTTTRALLRIADQIDAEHERRMGQREGMAERPSELENYKLRGLLHDMWSLACWYVPRLDALDELHGRMHELGVD